MAHKSKLSKKNDKNSIINDFTNSEPNNGSLLNIIGYLYNHGIGVQEDYNKAKDYYEKSAELGNSHALNNLGNLYFKGYGVKKDSRPLNYLCYVHMCLRCLKSV